MYDNTSIRLIIPVLKLPLSDHKTILYKYVKCRCMWQHHWSSTREMHGPVVLTRCLCVYFIFILIRKFVANKYNRKRRRIKKEKVMLGSKKDSIIMPRLVRLKTYLAHNAQVHIIYVYILVHILYYIVVNLSGNYKTQPTRNIVSFGNISTCFIFFIFLWITTL